jgi:hypothetical protein
MNDSDCSVVTGDPRALAGGFDEPVAPDRGGAGEQASSDPGDDPGGGSPAVLLQTELALEGHPIEGSPSEHAPMGCPDTPPDGDPWEHSTVSREASQGTGVESSRRS